MTDTHAALTRLALDAWGTAPEFLWSDSPDASILRHPRTKKWFAVFMTVARRKLGLDGDGNIEVMNVKCSPDTLATLLGSEGFHPAYHMNKSHWLTILLDGTVPTDMIYELMMMSYELIG